jgi:phosphoribosylanthranilate isomerase
MGQRLWVKVCGVTRVDEAVEIARLDADALGLNFYPGSPRCLDLATAGAILRELPDSVEPVGVFVNRPLREVAAEVAALTRLRTIQWHGSGCEVEVPAPYQLVPAFPVRDADSLRRITDYLERCRACGRLPRAILVDAHVAGQYGGTGRTAPWELLESFRPGVPLILAGGLTPDNVAEAVRRVRPWAVDVASGVESSPGRKDLDKVRRFLANARSALESLSAGPVG